MEVLFNIMFVEVPAGEERDSHAFEVPRKDRAVVGHDGVLLIFRSARGPEVAVPVRESILERQVGSDPRGFDAGQAREIGLQGAEKLNRGGRVVELLPRH